MTASAPPPAPGLAVAPRPPAPPRTGLVRVALVVTGVGLGISTGLAITPETSGQFTAPGGLATFAGSLTGLTGTYLALVMVLLVSRVPFVERVLGHDGLLRWHQRLSPWPIGLLVAHAVFITVGYAQAARTGLWHQAGVLLDQYPDMVIATAGLGLLVAGGVTSVRAVRRRLGNEIWWTVHLLLYLALALSFAHVIALGPAFVDHPLTQAVWWAAWAATAGLVLAYRVGLPVVRSLRYRLRVAEVRQEGPGVVSVIVSGHHLDRLTVSGGQFFYWRFLARGLWWQARPYSLSALPHPPYLRLTIKDLGDHSASVARLRPGTKIAVEGPYGTFTRYSQQHRSVLLIAAGIGVTALRALLEDLPDGSDPVVIVRATRQQDLVLRPEIRGLTEHKGGVYHELFGRRDETPLDEQVLTRLVPGLDRRDVFIVGSDEFVASVTGLVRRLGIRPEAIHHEAFVR